MLNNNEKYDYLIIGAGIIGLTVAHQLLKQFNNISIAIVEKESDVAKHASGRNSGVLHAGFYYTADSLKARFTIDGNVKMKYFCKSNDIYVNETKKVVIAKNKDELVGLEELYKRGINNGVDVTLITSDELSKIDSNILTYEKALYSPSTASVDPLEVCLKLKQLLLQKNVKFYFDTKFNDINIGYDYLINCAGSYSDKIAHQFGLAQDYTMLPFKGIYLKYLDNKTDVKTNIYPVPNLSNPFLGIHYTITVDGSIKIGPSAIPAFWRENYKGFDNFNISEMVEILYYEVKLFVLNSFNFRKLALDEIKNYSKKAFIQKAKEMVKKISNNFEPIPAGIRAQLLNKKTNELVQDFVLEHSTNSTHILNAVSPAFTCSFAFAEYVVEQIIINKGNK